jgi:hypothetical protein
VTRAEPTPGDRYFIKPMAGLYMLQPNEAAVC